ncbi:GIY-YIG nuclease family protein [Flavobacterium sp. RSSB_23]|uniref:GIY-YIG nuclease family protein n=1 Tax=Flavobacterium sp. RSSB_23 TaxID=3447668 RepID=UPI003F2E51B3
MRELNHKDTFATIEQWLDDNLEEEKSFVPHATPIPNIKSKGIYFWFMQSDRYKVLSGFVTIHPIEPHYTKYIDGVKYDLVYLGTSGTGKQGNSNIYKRLLWHIEQNHKDGEVYHGTLSTLRAGLGALLADDLIIPNTESLVNTLMKKYMKIYWIEYLDDKFLIDNDEKYLIKAIKPLLNLKNNPNARANAQDNSTQVYKIRRAVVYMNTKQRLGNI